MKRRAFLVGFAAAPWWIRRAFADASVSSPVAARTTTRPTLVLVVPADESERYERGSAFGEWLNHGGDRELAPLALVDVVCARASDYGVSGTPLLLLAVGSTVHRLDGKLPRGDKERRELLGAFARKLVPLDGKSASELARSARERYVKKAPRGARWGRTSMCGATYEEGPADNVDCGMGSLDEPARRFLDFYVKAS